MRKPVWHALLSVPSPIILPALVSGIAIATGAFRRHAARAARAGPRRHRRLSLGIVVLVVALAATVAARLDVSPMLAALLDRAAASRGAGWALLALYALLIAVPFVPGAEIGLALLLVFGARMAGPVYVATVLALSLSFALGRLASRSRGTPFLAGLPPVAEGVLPSGDGSRGRRWLRRLVRFRWLALALLLNMPGNTMIGGGGGIAMAAGYGRVFAYPAFLACVAVAVAPVPALFVLAEWAGFGDRPGEWFGSVP